MLGVLSERLIDVVWEESVSVKTTLLSILDKLDLIAERHTQESLSKVCMTLLGIKQLYR